jgi:hypothetical protein
MPDRAARLTALEARYIARMRRALVRSVEPAAAFAEAGAGPELAATRVSSAEVVAVLADLYAAAGMPEARASYASLLPPVKVQGPAGLAGGWLARLRRFISTEGAAAVRGITETTRQLVRSVLQESAAAGDSVQVAAGKLRARVAQVAPARATRIVRTELITASNVGSLLGAEATGLKLEKVWLATPDGRTRLEHARANDQGVPLQGGVFTVGSYPARYPGDPLLPASERVNCRCSVGYRKVV